MQTVHFEQRVGNREMFQSFFFLFFFFLPQFNYSQTFHVRPPSPILRWNGRTDSRRGIFFDALFIPADISSIDVYCLFEKAVNFSRSRSKVELMESKQESWLTRIEKMKFVYIFVRVCVYSGPRSASFEQMTSASFVVVDIVERERRREETKGLSALNFTFHSWLAFLFFHHSDGLY